MTIRIIGNDTCHSPYNGQEPIFIRIENAPAFAPIGLSFPTNKLADGRIAVGGIATAETIANENGEMTFPFNYDINAEYLQAGIANGWKLPTGVYQFTARIGGAFETEVAVPFNIIGTEPQLKTTGRAKKK